MSGQAEHECVIRKADCGAYKALKVVYRHNGVNRRHERRDSGKPGGDKLKARVPRRRRPHNQVKIEILTVVAKPPHTIVAPFVDNNRRSANVDGAKTIKSMADQRLSANRR